MMSRCRLSRAVSLAIPIAVAVLLILFPGVLAAWEWPLSSFRVDAGFAQMRNGEVTSAVWLSAQEPQVSAAHPGEVIFTKSEGRGVPHGFGNFAVLEHEDGLRSVYTNMGAVEPPIDRNVETGAPLGTVGVSGFAYGDQLGFHLIDGELQQLVNPFLILPPLEDTDPPVISSVLIADGDSPRPLSRQNDLLEGSAVTLLVEAYDTVEGPLGTRRIPPKRVAVTVGESGEEAVLFDTMQYGDDGYRLSSGHEVNNVYAEDGRIRVGTFPIAEEVTRISVRVEDFAGNRASAEYQVSVIPSAGAR
jgi:hypothetical protein